MGVHCSFKTVSVWVCYFSLFMCSPLVNLYPCIPGQHMDSQPIEVYIYAAWGAKVCRMRNLSNFWRSSLLAGHDLLLLKPSKSPPSPAYTCICIAVWSATINRSMDQTIEQSTNQSVKQINQSNQNQVNSNQIHLQFKSNSIMKPIKYKDTAKKSRQLPDQTCLSRPSSKCPGWCHWAVPTRPHPRDLSVSGNTHLEDDFPFQREDFRVFLLVF